MQSRGKSHYDIVIAGGGMIGASLAVALAPLDFRVAVVEPVARGSARHPSFDDRSTALSRSSRRMFEAMGLWQEVAAASTPIASIHVSDRGRFGFSHIDAAEQNVDALGHVVINRVLGEVLHQAAASVERLEWICPGRITAVSTKEDRIEVAVATGDEATRLSCDLLVAADGAGSTVRDLLGIGANRVDYRQTALTGNLLPELPPANRAFERFTDSGALALLPVTEQRAAFIWILPSDEATTALQLPDDEFLHKLQDIFGYRLGRLQKVGHRSAFPLALTKACRLTARRSVLVGNAAHGLHPVAAQGFNLGMRDVATLCDLLADRRAAFGEPAGTGEPGEVGDIGDIGDIGGAEMLEAYASWRRSDHRKLVYFTDGLVRLFGSRRASLRVLRDVGMLGFDLIPGVRGAFARHTMGLAGRLPRLSRGVPLS